MRTTIKIASLSLLLAAGASMAQTTMPTVEVRMEADKSGKTMVFTCENPQAPTLDAVNKLLDVGDSAQSPKLRKQLMTAVGEACSAMKPKIQVARAASGLVWKPLQ